jgi:hypothetical protein
MIVLYKMNVNSVFSRCVLREDFRKEPSGIDVTNRLEELDVSNLSVSTTCMGTVPPPPL